MNENALPDPAPEEERGVIIIIALCLQWQAGNRREKGRNPRRCLCGQKLQWFSLSVTAW